MIKKLVRDGSLYSFSGFISRGISLILLPFYVRYLSQEEYGLLDLILLLVNFINITFSLELTQAIARFLPSFRLFNAKINLISTSFWILIFTYLLFFLLFIIFKAFILQSVLQVHLTPTTYYLIGIFVVLNGLFLFFQNNLRWDLQSIKFSVNSLIYSFFNLGLVSVFLFHLNWGINGVLIANIGASLIAILSSYFSQNKYYSFIFSKKYAEKLISFSFPLIFSSVSVYLSLYVDRIIINKYLGLSELAIFGVSYRFASLIGLITLGFSSALTPLVYNSPFAKETKSTIVKLFFYFLLGSFIFLLFISLFSLDILLFFTTKNYLAAKNIMPIITASVIFSSFYIFFPGLSIEGKTKKLALINSISACMNLVLCLVLVERYGVFGVALATLTSSIFSFLINSIMSGMYYNLSIDWWLLGKIIITFILFFGLTIFINLQEQRIVIFNEFFLTKVILFLSCIVLSYYTFFKKINKKASY